MKNKRYWQTAKRLDKDGQYNRRRKQSRPKWRHTAARICSVIYRCLQSLLYTNNRIDFLRFLFIIRQLLLNYIMADSEEALIDNVCELLLQNL